MRYEIRFHELIVVLQIELLLFRLIYSHADLP
jgi:hypothetical protein